MKNHFESFPWTEQRLVFVDAPPQIVSDVVARAMREEQLNLTPDEIKALAAHKEQLKEHASQTLQTREQLLHLQSGLEKDRQFFEENDYIEDDDAEVIENLEREFKRMSEERDPANPPPEVSDIVPQKTEQEKEIMEKIIDFAKGIGIGVIGGIVRGFIALRRMYMDLFPPKDPTQENRILTAIEGFYGRFLGAAELQELANKSYREKGVNLSVVEGRGDARAYAVLKSKYRIDLKKKLENAGSEEEKQVITQENTFEQFVPTQIASYLEVPSVARLLKDKSKEYVTTLAGIVEGQRPVSIAPPRASKEEVKVAPPPEAVASIAQLSSGEIVIETKSREFHADLEDGKIRVEKSGLWQLRLVSTPKLLEKLFTGLLSIEQISVKDSALLVKVEGQEKPTSIDQEKLAELLQRIANRLPYEFKDDDGRTLRFERTS